MADKGLYLRLQSRMEKSESTKCMIFKSCTTSEGYGAIQLGVSDVAIGRIASGKGWVL